MKFIRKHTWEQPRPIHRWVIQQSHEAQPCLSEPISWNLFSWNLFSWNLFSWNLFSWNLLFLELR
ncbi:MULTISPECIES: hypothetical protein [Pseudomonas]|uniref:hypothetical protein n=1 Tax=Pseudomonas TaxID=286 RepID=UPI0005A75B5A|nr:MULTISPECIES: hypothetical protein [Pseudomonas]KAB0530435.1 hypothetical protein F7R16_19000 [Pseudomonas chlororaphis subsp. aureofaciens]TSD31808.1 hypothetical protein FCE86_020265 [Pseudomonas sp. ATCC 13985]WDG62433.1 hypothetical protein PUP52_10995 [Pseudomonas chlororaphis]WDG68643.1 hypothetical protein PUP59_11000 [Pseudomonas chlororaphis]